MPIDLKNYPPFWRKLSRHIRFVRAGGRCEGLPGREVCGAVHGGVNPKTGGRVWLSVAHLDHNPQNNRFTNLRALCQKCHTTWDFERHNEIVRRTWAKKRFKAHLEAGQLTLPISEVKDENSSL